MDNHWDNLPEHLQDHIKAFIPMTFMGNALQKDIQTAAALVKIRRMDNEWHDLCNSPDKEIVANRALISRDSPTNCQEYDDEHIADSLLTCGCCVRHCGFVRPTKLFTNTKTFIDKIALDNRTFLQCTCSCRHHRRMLV
jgi:hypothetical protein